MKSYKSIDTHTIAGRGLVKVVKILNPGREKITPGLPKSKDKVRIDDVEYEVLGIECAMALTAPPYMKEIVGLLVKETHYATTSKN